MFNADLTAMYAFVVVQYAKAVVGCWVSTSSIRTSHVTFIHNAASVTTKTSAVTLLSSFRPSTQPLPILSATFRNILILRLLTSMVVPSMTSQPPTSPRALKSSSSGNAERPRLVHRSSTVEVPSLREVSRDENARPSCPVAATLAEELTRACSSGCGSVPGNDRGRLDDVLVFEAFVSEGDITEVDIFLDDIPVEIDLRKVSHVPTDVVADDSQGEAELRSLVRDIPHVTRGKELGASPANEGHRVAHGPHTLRERHMSFLRAMHTMSNKPEPMLPRAVLRASAPANTRTQWRIEAGTLGKRVRSSGCKAPEYMVKYGGSPIAFLNAQRATIVAELRQNRTGKQRGLLGQQPNVPQPAQNKPSRQQQREDEQELRERQREEVAKFLRDAEFDATDLDEGDMEDVVNAVMSAAAEVARFVD